MKDMRWNEADLVNQANGYAKTVLRYKGEIEGESQEWKPPALMARTIGMMQLRAVKHLLNVEKDVRPATTRNGARGGNIGGARGGIRKQF
jgi:precorrin isomerase